MVIWYFVCIDQLGFTYTDYGVISHFFTSCPFIFCFQICLEMLYFASYSGDTDSSIVRETWARLIDQALAKGGIAEACSALKRIGSHVYPGDTAVLPLDTLCLHLEKAALVVTHNQNSFSLQKFATSALFCRKLIDGCLSFCCRSD